jgi:hypothetical protein
MGARRNEFLCAAAIGGDAVVGAATASFEGAAAAGLA